MTLQDIRTAPLGQALRPNVWDVVAIILVIGAMVLIVYGGEQTAEPLSELQASPVSLDPANLPLYALRTTMRMLLAIVCSTIFTFIYAAVAAKSRRAEIVLVPLLDILQSVPILGFSSITIVPFMTLTPGRVAGAEMACIFVIFTSQAWNMAFSFYQSLRTIPDELQEVASSFRLSPWLKFWRLEVPFGMPQLIWNMMMSMSGGWFFVVYSEAMSVGNTTVALPGVGSYVAEAIAQSNLAAIGWAIAAMFVVILAFDQLLFRPLIAGADWFRLEQETGFTSSGSWVLTMLRRSRLLNVTRRAFARLLYSGPKLQRVTRAVRSETPGRSIRGDIVYFTILGLVGFVALWKAVSFVLSGLDIPEVGRVIYLGLLTLLRVVVLIALASLLWVPIGVYIGMRPRVANIVQPIAQFLSAFPANLLFPVVVSAIVLLKVSPNVWLSPLMILGTQWYILFNVIAGASAIPTDMRHASENLKIRGWLWWRRVALPAVFPFYLTGAITASGGSWNASIAAEVASWGHQTLTATGLGAYIKQATDAGDFRRIVLGIAIMSLFVVLLNRFFWRPLYVRAERKFRMS